MIMMFIMFQQNDRKKILICQTIGNSFFCIHYFLLGTFTGAVLNAISATRAMIYFNREKKFFNSPVWLWFFMVVSAVAGVLTWEGTISILPTVGMVIGSVSVWVKKPRYIRILCFIPSPMWMTYNIVSNSIPGIITEAFVMISILISIVRYDILKKEEKHPTGE